MESVEGKWVTVAGLGRFGGGIAVCRWLVRHGANVRVADRASAGELAESVRQLDGLPIEFHLGDQSETDFTQADLVVASPAIPPNNPMLNAAAAAGVPITTEIRLFVERCEAPILGVTGTKGKSTTTALLGRMLEKKFRTWVGGNIGKSLLDDLAKIRRDHLVVLELSSFMLHHLGQVRWSPHVAVVTMISSDHLDWHGSAEAYVDAKRNIVRFQQPDDFAVLNQGNELSAALASETRGQVVLFPQDNRHFQLALAGQHNQLNAQAAFAAAKILGIPWEQAQETIEDFSGLPHRLQLVKEIGGVRFINDSIATVPEAAIAALNSFPPGRVIQIVGGSKKKDPPIADFCRLLARRAKAIVCIGETGPKIAAELAGYPAASVHTCGDLPAAVRLARSLAVGGDVILLSPGYASFDQFANFEKRGEVFAALAEA